MIDAINFGAKIVPLPGPGEDIAGGLAKNFVDEGISKAREGMAANALKEFASEADRATANADDAAAAHLDDVKARAFYAMVNAGVVDITGDDLFDQDGDGVPTAFADLNPASAISSIDAIMAREGIMTEHDFKSAYEDPFVEYRTGKGTA